MANLGLLLVLGVGLQVGLGVTLGTISHDIKHGMWDAGHIPVSFMMVLLFGMLGSLVMLVLMLLVGWFIYQ